MTEPMTEERLAELRQLWGMVRGLGPTESYTPWPRMVADAVDEIDRLRAENDRLVDALGAIGCSGLCDGPRASQHFEDCGVRIAWDALNPEASDGA